MDIPMIRNGGKMFVSIPLTKENRPVVIGRKGTANELGGITLDLTKAGDFRLRCATLDEAEEVALKLVAVAENHINPGAAYYVKAYAWKIREGLYQVDFWPIPAGRSGSNRSSY